jgi:hypothetical protein
MVAEGIGGLPRRPASLIEAAARRWSRQRSAAGSPCRVRRFLIGWRDPRGIEGRRDRRAHGWLATAAGEPVPIEAAIEKAIRRGLAVPCATVLDWLA